MPQRSGLTRVDLLVLLLIVAVGGGLLLGIVTRVRETADATTCQNNLRQINLSIANYVSEEYRLPPLADQGKGALTGKGLPSIFGVLVPHFGASPYGFRPSQPTDHYLAHSSVMFTFYEKDGSSYQEGGGLANQSWRLFIDPSDRTASNLRDVPMTLPDGSTGYYATGSYAANGQAPWGKRFKPSVSHGLSNLILFGERPQVCMTSSGEMIYNLWGVGFYSPHMPAFAALTPDDPPGLWSTGQVAPASLPDENAPDHDSQIRVRIGRQSAEPAAPDFATPIQLVRRGRPCDPRLPGTPHRNGMQTAMADGSVRVFARDTSPWVFWSMCMPERSVGGE